MFLEDPLSPVRAYVHQFAMTGVGLFLEGAWSGANLSCGRALSSCFLSVSTCCCSALSCCYEMPFPAWNLGSCSHAGYVIFSISNNSTLFKQSYKKCWSTFTTCNQVRLPISSQTAMLEEAQS